jgi:hypothetical protein
MLVQFAAMVAATGLSQTNEHLGEIAEILAAGLQRAFVRKSSEVCATTGESSLHLAPDQSGDPTSENRRTSDA